MESNTAEGEKGPFDGAHEDESTPSEAHGRMLRSTAGPVTVVAEVFVSDGFSVVLTETFEYDRESAAEAFCKTAPSLRARGRSLRPVRARAHANLHVRRHRH